MTVLLKVISILLMLSAAILIYTETTGLLIGVIPFVAGALLTPIRKVRIHMLNN